MIIIHRAYLLLSSPRRVHISSVTLEHLKGSYKVEPGEGQSRDFYLKEHGVITYLVINPKVRHENVVHTRSTHNHRYNILWKLKLKHYQFIGSILLFIMLKYYNSCLLELSNAS